MESQNPTREKSQLVGVSGRFNVTRQLVNIFIGEDFVSVVFLEMGKTSGGTFRESGPENVQIDIQGRMFVSHGNYSFQNLEKRSSLTQDQPIR
jgi:hypothetical protein